jgi:hypothetical protein
MRNLGDGVPAAEVVSYRDVIVAGASAGGVIPVRPAVDGEPLRHGRTYVAPARPLTGEAVYSTG